jgi:hypothetical protein
MTSEIVPCDAIKILFVPFIKHPNIPLSAEQLSYTWTTPCTIVITKKNNGLITDSQLKTQINQITNEINANTQNDTKITDILSKIDLNTIHNIIHTLNTKQQIVSQMVKDYDNLSTNYNYKQLTIPQPYDTTLLINKSTYCNSLKQDYNKYQVNYSLQNKCLPEIKTFNIQANKYKEDYIMYNDLLKQINDYEQQLHNLKQNIIQLNDKKSQIKVCPTCGHQLEE